MGLAIKHRKKFVSHKKRWDKATIEEEKALTTDYALKNKKEIRKVELQLSKLKKLAKELNSNAETKNSEEAKHFVSKLKSLGYLDQGAESLDEVLDIKVRDLLERRLANVVYRNKLARTPNQARQFVVHGHIKVNGRVVSSPSFSVPLVMESTVEFVAKSALSDENHPERRVGEGEGMEAAVQEMEEVPISKEKEGAFDKREAALDEEEQDEVQE